MTVKDVKGMEPGWMPSRTKIWVDEDIARKVLLRCKKEHLCNRKMIDFICDRILKNNPYDVRELTCMDILKFIRRNEELEIMGSESPKKSRVHLRYQERFIALHERSGEILEELTNAA